MASSLALGDNIYRLRKEARLTQDDLAAFLGVTKASVSKWETGQSFPDIELLPKIATYFDVTVDDIIGYEPQMAKAAIAREYARLRTAFAEKPFGEAHAQCQQLARNYYSCYPLLNQIIALYINHADLADPDARGALLDEALRMCRRIRSNSDSSADVKQAEGSEALILLMSGKPDEAVDVLHDTSQVDVGADILLANAYSALGQLREADKALQGALLQSLVLGVQRLSQLAMLHAADREKLDATHKRTVALIEAFQLESLFLNCGAIYLTFAIAYLQSGDSNAALDCLEDYERTCRKLEFPLKLHGDTFFDKVEEYAEEANVLGTDVPRDEELVKRSLVESVTANPLFAALADDSRFRRIVASLEEIAR